MVFVHVLDDVMHERDGGMPDRWIPFYGRTRSHQKIKKAAHRLKVSRPTMIGHMVILWSWVMDEHADGDLSDLDVQDIALGAEWMGDADAFVDTLVRVGLLDRDGDRTVVHDWSDYGGRYEQDRRRRASHMRDVRDHGKNAKSDGHVTVTLPSRDPAVTVTSPSPTPSDPVRDGHVTISPSHTLNTSSLVNTNEENGENVRGGDGHVTVTDDLRALADAYARGTGRRQGARQLSEKQRQACFASFAPLVGEVDPDDVTLCIRYLQTDPFWREPSRGIPPHSVAERIQPWIAAGRPEAVVPATGKKDTGYSVAELRARRLARDQERRAE